MGFPEESIAKAIEQNGILIFKVFIQQKFDFSTMVFMLFDLKCRRKFRFGAGCSFDIKGAECLPLYLQATHFRFCSMFTSCSFFIFCNKG